MLGNDAHITLTRDEGDRLCEYQAEKCGKALITCHKVTKVVHNVGHNTINLRGFPSLVFIVLTRFCLLEL
jgi:hypothetical protein